MYLKLSTVFTYLNATPGSRCFIEGEAILESEHLVKCGIKGKDGEKWTVKAYCIQSSSVKSDPHEISGLINVKDCIEVVKFECTCKAGASGTCKHISAALLFCTRKPIEDLEELTCTDTECIWTAKKTQVTRKYESRPLHESKCFNKIVSQKTKLNKDEKDKLFQEAMALVPGSEFTMHLKGRRQNIKNYAEVNCSPSIPEYVNKIFDRSKQSSFITSLNIDINILRYCCKQVISKMKNDNVKEAMCCIQGSSEWKAIRKNRITGSKCYPVYTFKNEDWTRVIRNICNPKSVITKQMAYGIETEAAGFKAFEANNLNYDIKKIGVIINHIYPWLSYSPDGVIFVEGIPQRLLEIKCPYLGKIRSAEEVLPTLPYLKKDHSLKKKHSYYGQIQMGMALLNVECCDFIVYFSKDGSYLQITVPFDPVFAKDLLETVSRKYLNNIIHSVCHCVEKEEETN